MALATTTLNAAVGASASTVVLASGTNVTAIGMWLYLDREAMKVTALPNAAGVVAVQRGVGGTAALPHASGLTVYIGTADQFYLQDPEGTPPTVPAVTPWINLLTGAIWTVSSGAWIVSTAASGGTGTGLQVFQTSPSLTTPTIGAASFSSLTATATAAAIRPDTTTAHTMLVQGYDVNGTAYKTFITVTNGDTPDCTIAAPSGGTLVVQPSTYKSSDGTAGAAGGTFTSITSITVKDGIVTDIQGT